MAAAPYTQPRGRSARCNQHNFLAGGLSGILYWDWLFADTVWIDHVRRGTEPGRELMKHAETYAIAKGCHSAWLDTFPAHGFYGKLGYKVFGVRDDCPVGQRRWFLKKRLVQGNHFGPTVPDSHTSPLTAKPPWQVLPQAVLADRYQPRGTARKSSSNYWANVAMLSLAKHI
jgi:hypothetical protein